MSISVIKITSRIKKTILIYLVIAIFAVVADKIYAVFGHGVSSSYMTWMFLYPLVGGAFLYLLIGWLAPKIECLPKFRVFYNSYNSGIAVLTTGSLLKGILAIAGTDSPYVIFFNVIGFLFIMYGILMMIIKVRVS